ncbi:PREDICTED: little elongation complex subunit 1 isoform X2 [Pseudopodoces humilis]|uniref:little elongation complex subunit 1 isoform X2 n=1 Tax=Pseudopodoces humilis TaxID=181119 RepID=UPI0006B820FC|nr:PREDICTED: little elongation complex subunit 1 isoform X2 [Pseudopodoces humilis]
MIDGDRLLTEYQQKCTELQFAEREISALRCQVEKMLEKILPLEKCQEELGSLKAELEEKKSSLKIYRESQLECIKIKEEILNSDAVRRKLETKVKKLEEAATKHTKDFRELKTEKKRLEKELKKAQGKLDGVIKEKYRKFKHAETQSSGEGLATDIDKGRVKLLLEELWMCIDSATGKRENKKNDPVLASVWDKEWSDKRRLTVTEDTVQIHQKIRKCDGKTLPWCSSEENAVKQNSVTAMITQTSTETFGDDCTEDRTTEENVHSDEDKTVDVGIQTGSTSDFSDQEQGDPGGNVMDILNWARPLPALLSPVQLSPLTTQDMLLGEVTDSSFEEDESSTSAVESILQENQVQSPSYNIISPGDDCNRQSKSCEHDFDAEISLNLSWNEKSIHISPKMSSKEERDAERKQAEGATLITNMETNKDCLEENSEDMETENRELTGATAHESEDMEEQKGDGEDIDSEEGDSSADFMLQSFKPQRQIEKCSVVEQTEENVTLIRAVDNEGTHEKCGELVNAEREKLVAQRETPREASVLQSVTPLLSEECIVLQREDAEEKSDVLIENEVVENKSKNVTKLTDVAGAIEISAQSQCSEIKYDSEEILEKQHMQTKDEVNRECEQETVQVSSHCLPVSGAEGIRTLFSVFPKDEQLKIEDVNITRAPTIELAMKFNRESVLEVAELSELLHSAENVKLVDVKEGVYLQSKPHNEEDGSNLSQRTQRNLENILALTKTAHIIGAESSVAKCESSVLDFTEEKGEIKQSENLHNTSECEHSKPQNFRVFESLETEVKVNPEDCGGESSELLARGGTVESVLVESNPTSQEFEKKLEKPLTQLLKTENVKCDEIERKLNQQSKEFVTETCSSSLKWEKNVVEKNNISEIICQPTSEMDYGSGLAFSTQKDLEKCCINNEETNSPVQVGIVLESTRPPDLNFSLQKVVGFVKTNFTGKTAFSCTWENKGHTNSVMNGTFNCSSENLEEGVEILSAEKVNMAKELGCPERECVHKNEMKTSDKEQLVDKEPQASTKSQIMYANSYKNAFLLQKFDCQESGWRTCTSRVRIDPSLTGGGESQELNSFEGSGENAIIKCKSDFDMSEQNNDCEEKDCSIEKVKYVKCSECVPMFRNKLKASRRIAVDALETGAIVDADYQVCELHSMMHPGNTFTVSHLKAGTVVDMNTHCEPNSSGDTADEWSSVTGEGYPEESDSQKGECILITSENTESTNELMVESNGAGCISHSEENLLKSGTSKESPVMPNASKSRLPLCKMLNGFSENCRLTVKNSKLNTRMLALDNFLEENDSEKLQSNGEQNLLHHVDMGVSVVEEYNNNQTCSACNTGESSTDVIRDSDRKKNLLKHLPNPDVRCSCQTVGQLSEPQRTVFEKLHMVESESCALKKSNKLRCKEQEPSEILTISTKTAAQVMHTKLSKRLFQGKRKTKTLKVTQPVLANASTSVAPKCSSEMINKIREEIGPPLPPLLLPLIATPPKTSCTVSPVTSSTDQSSLLSPLDDLISPLCKTPILPLVSPLADTPKVKSALFSPPSPSEMAVGRRICSSPLKFCTSIPKHALPVPGRFPLLAAVSAGPGAPQENSVKILDTMYPELSARARTLNILKGNIQLNRCAFPDSQSLPGPVSQTGGFKAIASTSTAFVKAGSNMKSDSSKDEDKDMQNQQLFSRSSNHLEKRTLLQVSMPRSAKRLRLDSEPPRMEPSDTTAVRDTKNTISEMQEAFHGKSCEISDSSHSSNLEESLPIKKDPDCQKVALALKKVAESCFDLLPVIKGHVYVGNISKIPVMRDEEREVVYEFGIKNKVLSLNCVLSSTWLLNLSYPTPHF